MIDAAIFRGNYANIVTRKTRSVCVVEVEIPIERMADFIAAFGAPLPGVEIPVALARIDPEKVAVDPAPASLAPPTQPAERQRFSTMPLSKQAAIRCGDRDFQRFLAEREGASDMVVTDAESTAIAVREICRVESRADIRAENVSGRLWRDLEAEFQDWRRALSYEEIVR